MSIKKRLELLSEIGGSNLHWYGKSKESVGRKMAHITFYLTKIISRKELKNQKKS